MSQLQFSLKLVDDLKKVVTRHDRQAINPGVAAQYMAAAMGCLVAEHAMPERQKEELLDHFNTFAKQIMHEFSDLAGQSAPVDASQGVWKPD